MRDHGKHDHGKHDHDHSHCRHARERADLADTGLARAEELCAARRQRLTPIRRAVLEALYRTHAPLGAYELIAVLGEGGGKTHAPITIYRALDFLMEQGFVHRLASRNAFVACPHGHAPDELVAFLICEGCGGVDERHSPALTRAVSGMIAAEAFKPRQQVLEIVGLCGHCREVG
ncbi:MAG: transcriptional repressor [Salinarimonadaceae bacterium]|nr:MAG: transcriptional repressor [Salinarimonadaceae bacterium]